MVFVLNLTGYKLILSKKAKKNLARLDKMDSKVLLKKLKMLLRGFKNVNVIKLNSYKLPTYRMRCGDYRAVFIVKHEEIIVLVIEIDHRKDIYR